MIRRLGRGQRPAAWAPHATHHTATLLPNGKVLVAGGLSNGVFGEGTPTSSAELYDPATGTWTATLNMGDPHGRHTATLLPTGQVLVAGGFPLTPFSEFSRSAELYDPATGTWSYTGPLRDGRFDHTATLLPNGKVLAAGGFSISTHQALDTAELYNPATGDLGPACLHDPVPTLSAHRDAAALRQCIGRGRDSAMV